jgi:hypothetical protein
MKGRLESRMAKCKHPPAGKTGYGFPRSPYPRAARPKTKHGVLQGFPNTRKNQS